MKRRLVWGAIAGISVLFFGLHALRLSAADQSIDRQAQLIVLRQALVDVGQQIIAELDNQLAQISTQGQALQSTTQELKAKLQQERATMNQTLMSETQKLRADIAAATPALLESIAREAQKARVNITAAAPEVLAEILRLQGALLLQSPVTCPNLTMMMSTQNNQDDDADVGGQVSQLQQFLLEYRPVVFPEGFVVTGHYGAWTEEAVQKFQRIEGIADPGGTGWGIVGPRTRKKIMGICEPGKGVEHSAAAPSITVTSPGDGACYSKRPDGTETNNSIFGVDRTRCKNNLLTEWNEAASSCFPVFADGTRGAMRIAGIGTRARCNNLDAGWGIAKWKRFGTPTSTITWMQSGGTETPARIFLINKESNRTWFINDVVSKPGMNEYQWFVAGGSIGTRRTGIRPFEQHAFIYPEGALASASGPSDFNPAPPNSPSNGNNYYIEICLTKYMTCVQSAKLKLFSPRVSIQVGIKDIGAHGPQDPVISGRPFALALTGTNVTYQVLVPRDCNKSARGQYAVECEDGDTDGIAVFLDVPYGEYILAGGAQGYQGGDECRFRDLTNPDRYVVEKCKFTIGHGTTLFNWKDDPDGSCEDCLTYMDLILRPEGAVPRPVKVFNPPALAEWQIGAEYPITWQKSPANNTDQFKIELIAARIDPTTGLPGRNQVGDIVPDTTKVWQVGTTEAGKDQAYFMWKAGYCSNNIVPCLPTVAPGVFYFIRVSNLTHPNPVRNGVTVEATDNSFAFKLISPGQ